MLLRLTLSKVALMLGRQDYSSVKFSRLSCFVEDFALVWELDPLVALKYKLCEMSSCR